jgi:hypothetical protein
MRCLRGTALWLLAWMTHAENTSVVVHIKLVDGRNGEPMKNEQIGLEDRSDYHEIALRTDNKGIASLTIRRDAVILMHNTKQYVNCADERGGLIHNDYKVSEIVKLGVVEESFSPTSVERLRACLAQDSCFFSYDRGRRVKTSD